jgi:large conductance mechanosensitive channel
MLKEFKEFAMKGNMLDLAIGVVIGAAFGKIIDSLVNDVINPVIGMFGGADFSNMFVVLKPGKDPNAVMNTIEQAKAAGAVTLNYGAWVTTIINFLIVAFALFLVVKAVNRARREPAPAPAAPPEPSAEEKLLGEIRDLLKSR